MSKHTEGLWNVWQMNRLTVVANHGKGAMLIAECESTFISDEEQVANAKLIAAAPALLEALERITNEAVMDGLEDKPGWEQWIINARTAIEEARGKS